MNVHNTGLSTGTSGAGQLSLENYELELKVKAIKKKGSKCYSGNRTCKEYVDLARDPAHGNRISYQTRKERKIVLELEAQGELGYIVRDEQAENGADFIDTSTGIKWDVKSPVNKPAGHTSVRKGAFSVAIMMRKIRREVAHNHNVIIDTRRITQNQIVLLKNAISEAGLDNKILWYNKKGKNHDE